MAKRAPAAAAAMEKDRLMPARIAVIDYDETDFSEREIDDVDEVAAFRETPTVTWVNVRGVRDTETVNRLGEIFGLHPLVVEDILDTSRRPKLEDMVNYVFLSVKQFCQQGKPDRPALEQVSIVIGKHFVLTFEERDDGVFEPVREKLRKYKGRIRKMGADYLAYRLLDAVVDGYFVVLEGLGEKVEALQEKVVTDPNRQVLRTIQTLRIEMTRFYRSVWPLREVVGALRRDDLPRISKETVAYFRDVYDHTVQIIETMETDRDMISAMLDIYVSSVSNKMNEVMKVLTVIATIFIPMTFLAGVWGMNFKHMPELDKTWAYPAFWLLMIAVAGSMLLWFRKKKWL
jgi:magnesium transporter